MRDRTIEFVDGKFKTLDSEEPLEEGDHIWAVLNGLNQRVGMVKSISDGNITIETTCVSYDKYLSTICDFIQWE